MVFCGQRVGELQSLEPLLVDLLPCWRKETKQNEKEKKQNSSILVFLWGFRYNPLRQIVIRKKNSAS